MKTRQHLATIVTDEVEAGIVRAASLVKAGDKSGAFEEYRTVLTYDSGHLIALHAIGRSKLAAHEFAAARIFLHRRFCIIRMTHRLM